MLLKKMKIILILLFLIQSLIYSQEIFKGEVVISSLSAELIDTTYIPNPLANSKPSNSTYIIDKFVYEVIFTLRLYGNEFNYAKPLALTFNTPDNNSSTIIINQELYQLGIDEEFEFILNIHSKEKGWANIVINEWDMYNLEIVNNLNVNFINYSFYLE